MTDTSFGANIISTEFFNEKVKIIIMNKKNKLIIATTLGSVMEVFDFYLFIFLLPIINIVFFPTHGIEVALVTVLTSYLFRPIGGIILGTVADYIGRKFVLIISMIIMALGTFCIALLPSYEYSGKRLDRYYKVSI